jgi:hypothetical protein
MLVEQTASYILSAVPLSCPIVSLSGYPWQRTGGNLTKTRIKLIASMFSNKGENVSIHQIKHRQLEIHTVCG